MDKYSFLEKLIHDFCLGSNFVKRSLYEVEKILFYKKEKNFINKNHVFITGLPRAGTTAILEFIFSSKKFASLLYEDMPFILSPNLFSKIYRKKDFSKIERKHNDGIYYNLSSPESFDEVFFSLVDNRDLNYELPKFIWLVLRRRKKERYLSKNNLNYKRIDVLTKIFPYSTILIPFRDPVQHSASLLRQHHLFSKLQKKDFFVRKYMNYLNHHEFGLDHKSWNEPKSFLDTFDLNYWLEQWCMFYQDILKNKKNNKNVIFVSFEKLLDVQYLASLKKKLALEEILDFKFQIRSKHNNEDNNLDKKLNDMSKNIYGDLLKMAFNK